jgi:hemerythrin
MWKPEFAIGVAVIDEQHQKMFKISEQLDHIIFESHSNAQLGRIMHEIVDYTQYHFKEEETLMEEINYPLLSEHRDLHNQICDKIVMELRNLKAGQNLRPFELIILLNEWVTEHIMVEDMKIAAAYRADLLTREQEFKNSLVALTQKYEILHDFFVKGIYSAENYAERKENIAKKYCGSIQNHSVTTVKILAEELGLMKNKGIIDSGDHLFFQLHLAKSGVVNELIDSLEMSQQINFTNWLQAKDFFQAINPDKL